MSVPAKLHDAFLGSLVADAFAMPVHWYYDTRSLDHDYPDLEFYTTPRNPHPGSILWRSSYKPLKKEADILHGQSFYWGNWGVHYHQFLPAGESTLNFRLAFELNRMIVQTGRYDAGLWLDIYTTLMRKPGWHEDTYVEECHRAFFNRLASGVPPALCGVDDIHIGGLASVPAMVSALAKVSDPDVDAWSSMVRSHVALTHQSQITLQAAEALTRVLFDLSHGESYADAIDRHAKAWASSKQLEGWKRFEDRLVVGRKLTSACYLPDSLSAALFLCWKYQSNFEKGVVANALCGGDNCHRGAVVGAVLGAIHGVPEKLVSGLRSNERLKKFSSKSFV